MSDDALLENVYLMISIFRDYNIKPLFVFDGPPPKEKLPLLALRKEAKRMQRIRCMKYAKIWHQKRIIK